MKKLLLLIIFNCLLFTLKAQTWLWGKEGTTLSDTYLVAADNKGNAFLSGYFADSITFGSYHLTSRSYGSDLYLVKYDSNGSIIWVRQSNSISDSDWVEPTGIAADGSGNVYVAGYMQDTILLNGDSVINNYNIGEPFLAKYDANGNVKWISKPKYLTKKSGCIAYSVTTDKKRNVYIAGNFEDTVFFGKDTLKTIRTNNFGGCTFVVKYDSNGNEVWAKQSNSHVVRSSAVSWSVSTDNFENVCIAGEFTDTLYFGAYKLEDDNLYQNPKAFLVKYDSNGNVLWANQDNYSPDAPYSSAQSVVCDIQGNVYMTGFFDDSACFGGVYLTTDWAQGNFRDLFLVKYSSAGNLMWAKQNMSNGSLVNQWAGYSLASDELNHIYLSGGEATNNSVFIFNGDSLSINSASFASVVLQLDTGGNIHQGSILRTGGDDNNIVACSYSGKYVYFGGDLDDSVTFGNDFLNATQSDEPPFVARWGIIPDKNPEAIDKVSSQQGLVMPYPNPSSGVFQIQVISDKLMPNSQIEVFNILGEKVYSNYEISKSSTLQIDISNQPAGIYLYRITGESRDLISTGKLIIQK